MMLDPWLSLGCDGWCTSQTVLEMYYSISFCQLRRQDRSLSPGSGCIYCEISVHLMVDPELALLLPTKKLHEAPLDLERWPVSALKPS